jgi:hypothetical protein
VKKLLAHEKYSQNQREYHLVMPLDLEEIIPEDDWVQLLRLILGERITKSANGRILRWAANQ